MIWTKRINSRDINTKLKGKRVQGTVLKGAFVTSEVLNKHLFYKSKSVPGKELRIHLSGLIKSCEESLVFVAMTSMERENTRRHYLSNILQSKLLSLTEDALTS